MSINRSPRRPCLHSLPPIFSFCNQRLRHNGKRSQPIKWIERGSGKPGQDRSWGGWVKGSGKMSLSAGGTRTRAHTQTLMPHTHTRAHNHVLQIFGIVGDRLHSATSVCCNSQPEATEINDSSAGAMKLQRHPPRENATRRKLCSVDQVVEKIVAMEVSTHGGLTRGVSSSSSFGDDRDGLRFDYISLFCVLYFLLLTHTGFHYCHISACSSSQLSQNQRFRILDIHPWTNNSSQKEARPK